MKPKRLTDAQWVIGSAIVLLAVLVLAQVVGPAARDTLDHQQVFTVSSAADTYRVLSEQGVYGYRLVLLDTRSRIVPRTWMRTLMESLSDPSVEPPVMAHNLTSALLLSGIAREVYFVPPEYAWTNEYARAANRADALPEGGGIRLRFYGAPVHVIRPVELPLFEEKTIVVISQSDLTGYEQSFIDRVTNEEFADIVVWQVPQ